MSAHTLMIRKRCLYPSELYSIQSDITHTDIYLCTHTQIKNSWATCNIGRPNYYQLPYINKPWHKSSDESVTLNTLEMLPRLSYCRPTGQIGRRWGDDRDKEHKEEDGSRKGNDGSKEVG